MQSVHARPAEWQHSCGCRVSLCSRPDDNANHHDIRPPYKHLLRTASCRPCSIQSCRRRWPSCTRSYPLPGRCRQAKRKRLRERRLQRRSSETPCRRLSCACASARLSGGACTTPSWCVSVESAAGLLGSEQPNTTRSDLAEMHAHRLTSEQPDTKGSPRICICANCGLLSFRTCLQMQQAVECTCLPGC